ncbi:MAG: glycosyltransferase family 25 protein, partial [Pseudomonadota bacterium]
DLKKRGKYACLLSHAHCWSIVAAGEDPAVLILEDDTSITSNVAQMIRDVDALGTFDLIFVNGRMKQYRQPLDNIAFRGEFLRVDEFHAEMSQTFDADEFNTRRFSSKALLRGAPGADGYVLSPTGARKLLRCFERFKMLVHADWLLYTLGIDPATLEAHPGGPPIARSISRRTKGRDPMPDSWIYARFVVRHEGHQVGGTVRGGTEIGG